MPTHIDDSRVILPPAQADVLRGGTAMTDAMRKPVVAYGPECRGKSTAAERTEAKP